MASTDPVADALDELRRGAQALAARHPDLDPQVVERIAFESHERLPRAAEERRVEQALAFAADRLDAVARAGRDRVPGEPLRVLVESIRNDGISLMAAAYLDALGGGRVAARSAGLNPAAEALRTVVDVMAEDGVPIDGAYPKPVAEEIAHDADVVVAMLVEHPLDLVRGQRLETWDFDDPAGLGTDEVRRIRDRVRRRVVEFLETLPA
ncbi:arsenate reductase ArsC [Agrococcus terreus]|uniref:Phosphotyrosine protein phosphatase I domain-containing protein n=1 Tax=Agrococcus terreus TaxID=574649 RepID=A0ABQ2KLW2_9MICO|nr:arsenate reductase ArsC [Agrococcus terreus]GGN86984.1 hypothetical protein GCM10010968_21050 [Agrococcus terreus]